MQSSFWRVAIGMVVMFVFAIRAEATIVSVTVNTSKDYEEADGYTYAEIMVLTSETDMVAFHPKVLGFGKSAFYTRNPTNPSWRQYEMAAVSHLPEPILSLGLPNQNTGDPRPIFRAAFDNLTRWTQGGQPVTPPPARYFEGSVNAMDVFVPTTDIDGHFAGGVRLPHVESTADGQVSGAPLGRHRALNPRGQDPFDPFKFLSGTFASFSCRELLDRFGSHDEYVTRVTRAADELAVGLYITREDRKALIVAAQAQPFPTECPSGDGEPASVTRPPAP